MQPSLSSFASASLGPDLQLSRMQHAAAGSLSQAGPVARADVTACSGFVLRGRASPRPEIFGLKG